MDIRPASPDDAALIFAWRNDPHTRAMFRDSAPVAWADHLRWLADTLQRPDRRLFMAADAAGPVGVVRFDREGDIWAVSVNLAPDRRGHGLSVAVLQAAMRQLPGQSFRAEIRPENTASRQLFSRAGYAEAGLHDGLIRMEIRTG